MHIPQPLSYPTFEILLLYDYRSYHGSLVLQSSFRTIILHHSSDGVKREKMTRLQECNKTIEQTLPFQPNVKRINVKIGYNLLAI